MRFRKTSKRRRGRPAGPHLEPHARTSDLQGPGAPSDAGPETGPGPQSRSGRDDDWWPNDVEAWTFGAGQQHAASTEQDDPAGGRTAATSSPSDASGRPTELEPELSAWILAPTGRQVPPGLRNQPETPPLTQTQAVIPPAAVSAMTEPAPPIRHVAAPAHRRKRKSLVPTVAAAPARALGRLGRTTLVVLGAVVSVVVIALVVSTIAGGPDGGQTLQGPLASAVTGTTDRIAPGEIGDGLTAAPASGLVQPSEEEWTALLPRLEELAAADPADDYAQRRLALAYYNLGRLDEAEAIYLRLLEAAEDAVLRNRLGNTLRDKGDLAGAETAYRAVIATAPTLVAAYLNLAEVLWRQNRDAEAILVIDRGLAAVAVEDRAALDRALAVLESAAP